MRLWHTKLIEDLPKAQLVAQWRELSAIAGSIIKNGTPNHILVNFVLDYPVDHFVSYAYYVRQELTKRKVKTMDSVWNKITDLNPDYSILPLEEVYSNKMTNDYLWICILNLYEKYTCGGLTEEEWQPIHTQMKNLVIR